MVNASGAAASSSPTPGLRTRGLARHTCSGTLRGGLTVIVGFTVYSVIVNLLVGPSVGAGSSQPQTGYT
jgi:hypothetical protein